MKKLISVVFTAALFLVIVMNSNAQDRHFGIKGGVTAYQLSSEFGEASATSDPKTGFAAGIFGEFPINKVLSIQPEVIFVQKGGEDSEGSNVTSSLTLSYVDVPLLLKINAPLEGFFKPYIFGGPYAGYLLDVSTELDEGNIDLNEAFADLHYGLKVGLGVHLGSVIVDVRYDMGIADLYSEDINLGGGDTDLKLTTEGIVLSAGITF